MENEALKNELNIYEPYDSDDNYRMIHKPMIFLQHTCISETIEEEEEKLPNKSKCMKVNKGYFTRKFTNLYPSFKCSKNLLHDEFLNKKNFQNQEEEVRESNLSLQRRQIQINTFSVRHKGQYLN